MKQFWSAFWYLFGHPGQYSCFQAKPKNDIIPSCCSLLKRRVFGGRIQKHIHSNQPTQNKKWQYYVMFFTVRLKGFPGQNTKSIATSPQARARWRGWPKAIGYPPHHSMMHGVWNHLQLSSFLQLHSCTGPSNSATVDRRSSQNRIPNCNTKSDTQFQGQLFDFWSHLGSQNGPR